ncbi:MAG: shikimate dehydrogenase [Thermodesulfovibrionia bacterium]|nr:MAG: shikimate dehydrogenase [Thermodesulfovibrionia bacterium]
MDVSGKTKIIGIFGSPIEHTLSPLMHNAAFKTLGLDMCYVAFRVLPGELREAVRAIKSLNLPGVNITVPHKEKVIPLLDKVNEEASFIGAVNTIVNSEGILTGYNTDGRGFISALSEKNISIENKDILVLGAGGASRAISYYLSEKASRLSLFDIDKSKAEKLIGDLNKIRNNTFFLENIKDIGRPDIIINATPLGLKSEDALPLSPDFIAPEMVVCDLVYKNTSFLQEAKKKGARTIDGSGMLLWQGILAFDLWTGVKPPVDVMRQALLSAIEKG